MTPNPFALMGIVNITPDSFSDAGKFLQTENALAHVQNLIAEGAHILDFGAESSRPGAKPLSADEELQRLLPVLTAYLELSSKVRASNTAPIISVDTYHAKTAKTVLELGAHCINDISACAFDPELLEVIAHYKPGYVLMHCTHRPQIMQQHISSGNIVDAVQKFFDEQLSKLTIAGLPEENILLDVGIGFGKSLEQNLELLRHMHTFKRFGRPLLAAISMKSLLHKFLDINVDDMEARKNATSQVTGLLGMRGICFHRVHHVAECGQALRLAEVMNLE